MAAHRQGRCLRRGAEADPHGLGSGGSAVQFIDEVFTVPVVAQRQISTGCVRKTVVRFHSCSSSTRYRHLGRGAEADPHGFSEFSIWSTPSWFSPRTGCTAFGEQSLENSVIVTFVAASHHFVIFQAYETKNKWCDCTVTHTHATVCLSSSFS